MKRLPRTWDALVQDRHSAELWHTALMPLDAACGLENDDSYGVYVELVGDDVKLHVPSLGSEARFDSDRGEAQDEMIRTVIAAAARALGLDT